MNTAKSDDVQTEGSVNGDKIHFKFLFANRDGLHVEIECSPSDTVMTMKTMLISSWPKAIGDTPPKPERIRLICMGKGILGPDNACIEQCDLPVFLTHPTPINVSVKPVLSADNKDSRRGITGGVQNSLSNGGESAGECCCVIS